MCAAAHAEAGRPRQAGAAFVDGPVHSVAAAAAEARMMQAVGGASTCTGQGGWVRRGEGLGGVMRALSALDERYGRESSGK
eukprot:COSAG02_NODE_9019_length_2358_cov_2.779106_3_plen_81_part_00